MHFKNKLLLQNVEVIVLDEADRMIDLGFSSQLKSIQKTFRGDWQTLLFSATFDASIETIAQWYMKENAVLVKSLNRRTYFVRIKLIYVENANKKKVPITVREGVVLIQNIRKIFN